MPRICRELDSRNATPEEKEKWEKWAKRGDGSSSFDLCADCAEDMHNEPWPDDKELKPYNREPLDVPCIVEVGAEHPSYDDKTMNYTCALCNTLLMEEYDG